MADAFNGEMPFGSRPNSAKHLSFAISARFDQINSSNGQFSVKRCAKVVFFVSINCNYIRLISSAIVRFLEELFR